MKQVYHYFQSAVFRSLLLRDSSRKWDSYSEAWANQCYNTWYTYLQERFNTFPSWYSYATEVIRGVRPFPWPESMTSDSDKIEANQELLQRTIAFVRDADEQRVRILLGLDLPNETPKSSTSLTMELSRVFKEIGDVAEAFNDSVRPDSEGGTNLSRQEKFHIKNEIREAIARLGVLSDALGG